MISREALEKQTVNFERLTGVKLNSSKEIVEKVCPSWEEVQKSKKVSGRKSHSRALEDEILLASIYCRFYIPHVFLG
jgi:hypothetical protein